MQFECPNKKCKYKTDTEYGLKVHYGQKHEGFYPDNVCKCKKCDNKFIKSPSEDSKYCSHECYSEDSKGFNKGFGSNEAKYRNKEWLKYQLSENDLKAVSNKCNVQIDTIRKWKNRHEIGLDYSCPSCDKMFSSLRGRNSHHTQAHDKSIRGTEFECKWCGQEFKDNRSVNHKNSPKYCSDCYGKHMEGKNNPNKSEERRRKISKSLIKSYAIGEENHKVVFKL